MSSEDTAARLAAYAADLDHADLDDGTVETAKRRVLDSVACAAGALDEAPIRRLSAYAASKSGDANARVFGAGGTASVEYAAFANAAAIRYLDWNDEYESRSVGHPSCAVGAVLAAADAHGRSGRDALLATVLAYEVQCRLCDARTLADAGIDHVTFGLVATALAAGRLAGLPEGELAEAVRIALAGHVALRQSRAGELTEWKGFAFGNAARNAVVAAELAGSDVRGPGGAVEGEFGLANLLPGPIDVDVDAFGGRGGEFRIGRTNVKPHPVCYHAQGAVDCAIALRDEVDVDGIERITVETFARAIDVTADAEEKWAPETRDTADHSMPYCVARALLDGAVGLDAFEPGAYTDPEVCGLMERVEVVEDPALTARREGDGASPHAVTVEADGGTFRQSVEHPRGHHRRPMTDGEFAGKVEAAAGNALSGDGIDALVAWAEGLDGRSDLSEPFDLLGG